MTDKSARFVTGPIWRHVIVMTLTNSIGLMAMFLVDLIDLYFLNLLGEQEMAASVGFSAQLMFYVTALGIGFLIAVGILVAQRVGAKQLIQAKQIATSCLIISTILIAIVSTLLMIFLPELITRLGAQGRTFELAITYSKILIPSSVIVVLGMVGSAVLRAIGDARRAMNVTLLAAIVNLCLDPLLIFVLDMGIAGAAWASVLARLSMALYALYCVIHVHRMIVFPTLQHVWEDFIPLYRLAGPAILTNLATPIGSTFVMTAIARYGDAAVAAYATIGRFVPVAFSVLFALSGAISPIIGQNFGAQQFDRVKATYRNAMIFTVLVVLLVTLGIYFGKSYIVDMFNLSGEAAELVTLFCSGLTLFFIADGVLFSTNSAFNSLGYPLYSTFFNYAKFFLGVIPMVYLLAYFFEAKGVIIGQAIGSVLVSLTAVLYCNRLISTVTPGEPPSSTRGRIWPLPPLWPTSSAKTQL